MVNVKIETNVINYKIEYKESTTEDSLLFFAYPNTIELAIAIIDGVKYEFDRIYQMDIGYKQIIKNLDTNRNLSKNQKKEILEKVNKIIKEGNEYFKTIIQKGLPIELEVE